MVATVRTPVVLGSDGLAQQLQSGDQLPTAAFNAGGPASVAAGTYTVAATDVDLIFSVACTVTLPAAASFKGRELNLKTIAAAAIISNASNVKPIASNTAGTAILAATAGKWCRMVSDGANWVIMAAA
jgi:hypothetical protein